jgi:calmodulin
MVLSQDDIDSCRRAFDAFCKENSGALDVWELREVMAHIGQPVTDSELFALIAGVDTDYSGLIDFDDFVAIVEKQRSSDGGDEDDLFLAAFRACGSGPNKGQVVTRDELIKVIKHDFGLTVDVDDLMKNVDMNENGEIQFDSFKKILRG